MAPPLTYMPEGSDIETLLEQLRVPVPQRAKPGVGQQIGRGIGGIGDALMAAAAVKAGGAPPQMGASARRNLMQEQQYQQSVDQANAENRATEKRIRIGTWEREQDLLQTLMAGGETQFFRADGQFLVDSSGNRFWQGVMQNKQTGDQQERFLPLGDSPANPVGTTRIASQPLRFIKGPEGEVPVSATTGRRPRVPVAGAAGAPGEATKTRPMPAPVGPVSSESNVAEMQAEETLRTITQEALTRAHALAARSGDVPGSRIVKGLATTLPGVKRVGRYLVGVTDPAFIDLTSSLGRLRAAFEEERKGNRLTRIRLAELEKFLPSGEEEMGDMVGRLTDLLGDIDRRTKLRERLQPGLTSRADIESGVTPGRIPDEEFGRLQEKRRAKQTLTPDEEARYRQALQERIKERQ